jgi:hypothetical protein
VGERALRKAADRLRDRPRGTEDTPREPEHRERGDADQRPSVVAERPDREDQDDELVGSARLGGPAVTGRLTRRSFRDS